ncbi:MAG: tyrosine-protein phosphatase [Acidaminococcaceae bacterium]
MKEVKESMVDIHTHVLSNIDDGAKDLAISLALLQMAAESGTTDIIATPHVIDATTHADWQTILKKTEDLNRNAKDAGIPIRVYAGAEMEMNGDILSILKTAKEDYCLAGSRYALIELPANTLPNYADEFLYELQLKEIVPVIAHPERHHHLAKELERLHQWVKNGAFIQCNLGSFAGKFGTGARKNAEFLLKNNMVHFLGTDAHSVEHRNTDTKGALELVSKQTTPEIFQRITLSNPRAILDNTLLQVEIPQKLKRQEERKEGFFARLFG